MELIALLLLLTQSPTAPSVETRIIESPESPISLVGLPCGEDKEKVRAEAKTLEANSFMESRPFSCDRACSVGVHVKDRQRVAGFLIATATAHGRGRIVSTITSTIAPASLLLCSSESYAVAVMSRVEWPVQAGIVYVAGVTFQDGTSWHIDDEAVIKESLRQWIIQPKSGQ